MRIPTCLKVATFLLLQFAFLWGGAQQLSSFTSLTVENGLAQNSVMAIAQDSVGFIWLGTRNGVNRYDGYRFKTYNRNTRYANNSEQGETTSLLTDFTGTLWEGNSKGLYRYNRAKDSFEKITNFNGKSVEVLYQDYEHNLWVGTLDGLYLLSNRNKLTFTLFLFHSNVTDPANNIYALHKDQRNQLWLGTGGGLVKMTYQKGRFRFQKQLISSIPSDSYVTSITSDPQQQLWIGTANGVVVLNTTTNATRTYQHQAGQENSLAHNDVRELLLDKRGNMWIGTQNGLSTLNLLTGRFTNYKHNPEVTNSISNNSIHHLFLDKSQNMWAGTYFGGVNVIYKAATRFKVYRNDKFATSLSGDVVSTVVEDSAHDLWIGTEGGGLNHFNRQTNRFTSYKNNPDDESSISSNLVKIIKKESAVSDNLIIGAHRGIINLFNSKTQRFLRIKNSKNADGKIGTAEIVALEVDPDGTLWIGSLDGLTTLKKVNGFYPSQTTYLAVNRTLKGKSIQTIHRDSRGKLWIGTSAGLFEYDTQHDQLRRFHHPELQSQFISCISENSAGILLIGTYMGGFSLYNADKKELRTFRERNGLINDDVLGIVEDNNKNLWISTANGLSELNIKTLRFRSYTKSDGLAGNEFNSRSFFKDSKGLIFFGGIKGLTSFLPKEIELNNEQAPLVYTGLRLFNQTVRVNDAHEILSKPLNFVEELDFGHNQNHFTIEYALLNYIKPDKNKYTYKLEGYDKNWNHNQSPYATYTNLPAGSYTFKLLATNNDGIPGHTIHNLKIHISPAPWASWWAYLIYVLLFSIILFLTLRYFFVRALLNRTKDIQQMKLRFFTNVSHEIRTPLTLILAPLEKLLGSTKDLPEINNQLVPIKKNADRLLRLVTELMDFRKTESGHLKLHLDEYNIVQFVEEIFASFKQLAASRNITYELTSSEEQLPLWFDKFQLEKVFFNLLSNAFKFTQDHGAISVSITDSKDLVYIKVSDNGIGISESSIEKLFTDFFQIESPSSGHIGSGIGLALSKSIVNAHEGEIKIESTPQDAHQPGYTSFTVVLKKGKPAIAIEPPLTVARTNSLYSVPQTQEEQIKDVVNDSKDTILIIEDNPEIRAMLRAFLIHSYQVLESENGQQGWEEAAKSLPDLIICDIMMPIMSGLELCSKLKQDGRTSHIPVVLLTAMDSHPQQVDGLETGADSYITKPFSIDLLQLTLRNLLQARKNMREKFSEEINLQPLDLVVNKIDQHFMSKVIQFIEGNMAEKSFGVQELADEVGMSQPILYKKIRAITDLSVNDFIKTIRLKKAAALLATGKYNIAEVSYLVGFNDPKYFSREFKKHYGETPKHWLG